MRGGPVFSGSSPRPRSMASFPTGAFFRPLSRSSAIPQESPKQARKRGPSFVRRQIYRHRLEITIIASVLSCRLKFLFFLPYIIPHLLTFFNPYLKIFPPPDSPPQGGNFVFAETFVARCAGGKWDTPKAPLCKGSWREAPEGLCSRTDSY